MAILLAWPSLATIVCTGAQAEEAPNLPPDIAHYYADYNFVAAFTTFDERVALQGGRLLRRPTPDLNSPRTKEIRER